MSTMQDSRCWAALCLSSVMASYSKLEWIGLAVTIAYVFYLLRKFWKYLYANYIGYALGKRIPFETYGEWAIVTGSTDGIGKAYAEEMAAKGLNIVLISRSLTKLETVAKEIEDQYKVKTIVIDVDFCANPEEIYPRIEKKIQGLEIGVLVNNVGMSYVHAEYLTEIPNVSDFAQKLINCNAVSVVRMTLLVLDQMTKRRKGLIMNLSTGLVLNPTPLVTMYTSTKGFVYKFSLDLAMEYAAYGITVQCVMPGWVATNMSRIRKPNWRAPTPKDYVRSQMRTIGFEVASLGYWSHIWEGKYYDLIKVVAPWYLNHLIWSGLTFYMNAGRRYVKKLRERELAEEQARNNNAAKKIE